MTSFPPITRIVTGHRPDGTAILTQVGPLPTVVEIAAIPGTVFHEVWARKRALPGSTMAPIRRLAR